MTVGYNGVAVYYSFHTHLLGPILGISLVPVFTGTMFYLQQSLDRRETVFIA